MIDGNPTVDTTLTIAEINIILECVSSASEFCLDQMNNPELSEEIRKNFTEKALILAGLGVKIATVAQPYIDYSE